MANWKKIGIITGIGAGVAGVITYVSKLKRAGDNLESVVRAKVHSLKADGITLRLDIQLKNPSTMKFKIAYPFVKVIYQGDTVGTSKLIDQTITLPKHGEANIQGMMITIPYLSLLRLGSGLLKALSQGKSSIINVDTISTVDLGWKKLPYKKSQAITLKAKQTT